MTPPAAALRACTPADLPALQAIYAHHVLTGTASFEIEPPDLAEINRRFEKITGLGWPWIVAEGEGGRVLGYAYCGPFRERAAYARTVENSVYIESGAQGRGLGRALMAELIIQARAAGAREMLAVIGDSGNAASIGLHAAMGFAHTGVFRNVGFKFGRWLDIVLMQASIG